MPKTQSTPQLTVYRSGLVNLNGEATRLMHAQHNAVDLLPPSRRVTARQGGDAWQLDRRAGSPSQLRGAHGRGILRFRAPARAEAMFAEQPPTTTCLRFELCSPRNGLDLYELRAVQQNPTT